MMARAFITGVSGLTLTAEERRFGGAERPWGFILFKRNIDTKAQVTDLIAELREVIGEPDAPVLIDQEGGRVQRFGPPHWPIYPPGAVFGTLYDIDRTLGLTAARLSARLIAADLIELGVTVDCLPLADVPNAGADAVIGNRAYGNEPDKVASRGMGEPPRTPISNFRSSIRQRRNWKGPILPRFGRWRTCRWP